MMILLCSLFFSYFFVNFELKPYASAFYEHCFFINEERKTLFFACIIRKYFQLFFHLVIVIWCVCKICFGKNLLIICDNMTSDSWYIHRIKNNKAKITDLLFSAPEKKLDSRVQYCEHIKKNKREIFTRERGGVIKAKKVNFNNIANCYCFHIHPLQNVRFSFRLVTFFFAVAVDFFNSSFISFERILANMK